MRKGKGLKNKNARKNEKQNKQQQTQLKPSDRRNEISAVTTGGICKKKKKRKEKEKLEGKQKQTTTKKNNNRELNKESRAPSAGMGRTMGKKGAKNCRENNSPR